MLEHALIYALIELKQSRLTTPGLAHPNPEVRRAALIALDQMDGGALHEEDVLPLLESDQPRLRQAALMVAKPRLEWSPSVAKLLEDWITAGKLGSEQAEAVGELLRSFLRDKAVREVMAKALGRPLRKELRLLLLQAIAESPGVEFHPRWTALKPPRSWRGRG